MENFVSQEMAIKLKKLGFNEKCFGYFAENKFYLADNPFNANEDKGDYLSLQMCSVPLLQQAFKWFRDKYNLHCQIILGKDDLEKMYVYYGEICILFYPYSRNTTNDQVDVLKNKIITSADIDIEDELRDLDIDLEDDEESFDSYEKTEIACLEQLIKMAKNKKQNP